jgi:hypothetical protein
MAGHVTLIGSAPEGLTFAGPARCLVGRADSCGLRLSDLRDPPQVSRQHCELIIDPPSVLVRDLGSQNGTFLNGRMIGSRAAPSPEALPLFDGDAIGVADHRLLVRTSPVLCSVCLRSTGDNSDGVPRTHDGRPICSACFGAESPETRAPSGEHLEAARHLLSQAHSGTDDLLPLRDYRVERELERGGMGVVYLARHAPTGRRVALKVMLPHFAGRDDLVQRFLREVKIQLALKHPHVADAFAGGQDGEVFFLAMEYCTGGSVTRLLRDREPLSPGEAVPIILQVLDALTYAVAEHGLVHRDLKPGNLLLTGDSPRTVKLADFGLARTLDDVRLTMSRQVLCTPYFCPRQQVLNSRDVGPEVDVWAAAACLYYLLTKSFVRDYPPGEDLLTALMQQPVVPIRRRRPDLPAALADLIDRALVEEPAVPSWSAAEFRQALLAAT